MTPLPDLRAPLSPGLRQLLRSEDVFATTLLLWYVDTFAAEEAPADGETSPLEWHPTTVWREARRALGVALPRLSFDRLMAALTLVTTDLFWRDAQRFVVLANVLAGEHFQPDEFSKADVTTCAWAVTEGLLLAPPGEPLKEQVSAEIRGYITEVILDEGFLKPPSVLRGLVDDDFASRVHSDFASDPELAPAIWQLQDSKTQDVNDTIAIGLTALLEQLKLLPLQNGSTKAVEVKIAKVLQQYRTTRAEP